jgi:spermidine synthase
VTRTIARATSERGELVLRKRDDGAVELRVNGVFVMDDRETRSEELLAAAALEAQDRPGWLLVGGLGLGYTVRTLLADGRVRRVTVVEIEVSLADWMRSGLVPSVLDDPRVEVRTGDVRHHVRGCPDDRYDGILLDVDNGPDYLVYDANAEIYRSGFLSECRRVLRPGGVLTVWSSTSSPDLASQLRAVFGTCTERPVTVDLQGRDETYYVYDAAR